MASRSSSDSKDEHLNGLPTLIAKCQSVTKTADDDDDDASLNDMRWLECYFTGGQFAHRWLFSFRRLVKVIRYALCIMSYISVHSLFAVSLTL